MNEYYKKVAVSERLPKVANENYLTVSKNGFEKPRFFNGTRFESAHYEGEITHWLEKVNSIDIINEIERRQFMILSEPNSLTRGTMISNLLIDLP